MRICDLPVEEIRIGLRIKSLSNGRPGTVVDKTISACDDYWWVQWDGESGATSGFFYNDCECEVIDPQDFSAEDLDAVFKAKRAFDPETGNAALEASRDILRKNGAEN